MSKKNVTLSEEVITEEEHARRYEEETKKVVFNIYKKYLMFNMNVRV